MKQKLRIVANNNIVQKQTPARGLYESNIRVAPTFSHKALQDPSFPDDGGRGLLYLLFWFHEPVPA